MADTAVIVDPFDPSPPLFGSSLFLSDDEVLPLPSDFPSSADFDFDIDIDFSVDDFFRSPEKCLPDASRSGFRHVPDLVDGFGVSSSSPHQSCGLSGNLRNSGPASPDSDNSFSPESHFVSQEVKMDEENSGWSLMRKNDKDGKGCFGLNSNENPRSSKFWRSEEVKEGSSCVFSAGSEEEEKMKARLIRNRESAQLSRQRKKQYVEVLEEKVRSMHSTINELNSKIWYIMAENANLRQQLGGNGAPAAVYTPPGSMAPMPFPWIPGHAWRPQGYQVPLVPIPRLKPQQPAPAPNAKKSESKKGEGKTKKVASVSLLGLLLLMLFCGVIVPGVNFRYGGTTDELDVADVMVLNGHKGRILNVRGRGNGLNGSDEVGLKMSFGECGIDAVSGEWCQNGKVDPQVKSKGSSSWASRGSEGSVSAQNSSETLPALLYVPRNGKHVKINGNLIIHSVLASERAMAQEKAKQSSGKGKETGLAIAGSVMSSLAVLQAGKEKEGKSNADDAYGNNFKSALPDDPMQQWFREGMAGPLLSSGMCTEVFQFEVAPTSLVPATSIVNVSSIANSSDSLPPVTAHPGKKKNRRMLYGKPIPLSGSTLIDSGQFGNSSRSSNFHEKKPVSSMVVSVLVDPREAGDGDGEGRVSPKSLSRIFVVLLLDSVKYVTYSCVPPLISSSPQLVN